MPGIDWQGRRERHTFRALRAAKNIDWPGNILLIIVYEEQQPPLHYVIGESTKPTTRRKSENHSGMIATFTPDQELKVTFI